MSDKIYKVILLGKIADGYDIEIVHEKLALVFDIDLKKIPKLLKNPTIIRKELTFDVAVHYKTGLEKIGVLCEIKPPLETDSKELSPTTTPEEIPEQLPEKPIEEISEQIPVQTEPEIIEFVPVKIKLGDKLRVIDVKMSFGAVMMLYIKIILASIPAALILGGIIFLIQQAIVMIISFI
jgi:hypothetical protein